MNRIPSLDPANASSHAADLLAATQKQLGRAPNLYRSMAASPTALAAYLAFRGVLTQGALPPQMMERIALLTASLNACDYCVAAHTFRGSKIGISQQELERTRAGLACDEKDAAALRFVQLLIERRGLISDAEFAAVKAAGWSDADLGEMIGHIALNVFSNYFNHVAQPVLDFPALSPLATLTSEIEARA